MNADRDRAAWVLLELPGIGQAMAMWSYVTFQGLHAYGLSATYLLQTICGWTHACGVIELRVLQGVQARDWLCSPSTLLWVTLVICLVQAFIHLSVLSGLKQYLGAWSISNSCGCNLTS